MAWATSVMAQQKEFYIVTVHLDGKTSTRGDATHPPETFPTQELPAGGGIVMRQPDAEGTWQIRAFVFQPAQITVAQGDQVTLHFLGVHGPSHTIVVEGLGEKFVVRRGERHSVTFTADKVGTIRFLALDRQPTMQGQVVVLPRP
ncbi:MAG: cupredoxin domain-containing protein [Candidatus Tectimicrobiota bacterium]